MTKLDQHFIDNGACQQGREWVAANCATATECWQKLLDASRVDWAIWWYVRDRGFDKRVESLARRTVLRAVRVHAANAMDAAKLPEQARALRAVPDTATFAEMRSASAAADAAARDAAWVAAWVAARDAAAVAADAAADADAAARWSAAAAADADDADVAASEAAAAADAAARWSAAAAAAAAARWSAAAAAAAAERKQQIADIRELLKCPWTEETP